MVQVPQLKMNNGYYMPGFGLGTFESFGEAGTAVKHAIDIGYRHFDTAYLYENEAEVGRAIRAKIEDGTVHRKDIFIVTKLWNTFHEPEKVEAACRQSLENLGLDYIDLYLMHWPMGYKERTPLEYWPLTEDGTHDSSDVDYLDTWKAMEQLVKLGLVRSIGISNFNSQQIERLVSNCEIQPVNNQIEASPQVNGKKLINYCNDRDIIVTAYCPLGRPIPTLKEPSFLYDSKLKNLGDKYNKTPAQVIFRYMLDIGSVPIPKTVTKSRLEENINVFDFKLSEKDIEFMDSYNTGKRVLQVEESKSHKFYPFAIEF